MVHKMVLSRSSIRTIDCVQNYVGRNRSFVLWLPSSRANNTRLKESRSGSAIKEFVCDLPRDCYVYSTLFLANKRRRRNERRDKKVVVGKVCRFDGFVNFYIYIYIIIKRIWIICSFETFFTSTIDAEIFLFSFS